ncbi:PRD domain-containing protein [Candidatus Enterococcus ferrettii]|uniref:PRD domain-containing protein n=1 Tax=Candidatus Enterococcus ferrettii TaxID=2815324 RepID=A0ABV0EVP0_9ENTE|nr:PRD domain-containing protein [Enterococcus sp. 665A]MBO1342393.1 PRD domain-containing protein [Enterococcus sp. 665A]
MKNNSLLERMDELTEDMLLRNNWKDCYADATSLSIDLRTDRSNISRKLNQLFRLNYLIKINGRPTLYFSRRILEETAKLSYLPATFNDIEEFEYFLYSDPTQETTKNDWHLLQKSIIGARKNEALSEPFQKLQLFFHYPNHRLNLLLVGEAATGKNYLVDTFGKTIDYLPKYTKEIQTITLDSYSNDPLQLKESIGKISLTAKEKTHLIIIHHLHLLTVESLTYLLQQLLSLQTDSKYQVQYLFTSQPFRKEQHLLIEKFLPNQSTLSRLNDRTFKEKMMFILKFLQQECDLLNQSFCVSKNILTCLLISSYKNNLTELKNEIMHACAHAYYNFSSFPSNSSMIDLQFSDLSDDLLNNIPDVTGEAEKVRKIFEIIGESDLYFLVNIPQQALALLETSRLDSNLHLISEQHTERTMTELVQRTLLSNEKSFKLTKRQFDSLLFTHIDDTLAAFFIPVEKKIVQLLAQAIRHHLNDWRKREYLIDFQRTDPLIDQAANQITDFLNQNYSLQDSKFLNAYIYCFLSMTNRQELDNIIIVFISQVDRIAAAYQRFFEAKYSQLHFLSIYMEKPYLDLKQETLSCYQQEILQQSKAAKTIFITDVELLNQSGKQLFNKLPGLQIHYPLSLNGTEEICSLLINTTKKIAADSVTADEKLPNKALLNYLSNSLIFLNPEKAYTLLLQILKAICQKLDLEIDDELTLHFVNHAAFMIERTIRNETLPYRSKKESTTEYTRVYKIVEKELDPLNNVFAIVIPQNELAFTSEIFYKYFVTKESI